MFTFGEKVNKHLSPTTMPMSHGNHVDHNICILFPMKWNNLDYDIICYDLVTRNHIEKWMTHKPIEDKVWNAFLGTTSKVHGSWICVPILCNIFIR